MSLIRSLIIPFTHNDIGSMDFTPVVLSLAGNSSSYAQEVAMAIVYETGWQHMSDNPESYAKDPIAAQFIANFITEWDDTLLINGEPAKHVVLARKNSGRWFIGGMKMEQARQLRIAFSKLSGDGHWSAHLVVDDKMDGKIVPTALGEETRVAQAQDVWGLTLRRVANLLLSRFPVVKHLLAIIPFRVLVLSYQGNYDGGRFWVGSFILFALWHYPMLMHLSWRTKTYQSFALSRSYPFLDSL
jgi:hypothetical protein